MRLIEWRLLRGKTQEWLSRETGISQALLSKYERGAKPKIVNINKIAEVTSDEVTFKDWCEEKGEMKMNNNVSVFSKLGFRDQDKKNPLHDLACRYIIQEQIFNTVVIKEKDDRLVFNNEQKAMLAVPLNKKKTTISFLDAIIPAVSQVEKKLVNVPVEVKIASVELENILQQINFYRNHMYAYNQLEWKWSENWLLVVAFDMTQNFVDGLLAHQIVPVRLGENFHKWAEMQRSTPAKNVISI